MMNTVVRSPKGKEVVIGENQPTVLIGERINPFGKGPIKDALLSGDLKPICDEALAQVEAGADILIINVNAFGVDETVLLPKAVEAVMNTVDVPLCLESRNVTALENALKLGCGRPIVSSVTGEQPLLDEIMPLVKKYDTSVIAMASDGAGIPNNPSKRVEIAGKIIDYAEHTGIKKEDVIIDCLAESVGVNNKAALITFQAIEAVKKGFGVNTVLGASNISFGMPNRSFINIPFLSLAIASGLTAAIVNVKIVRPYILATDLLMGKDLRSRRYMNYCRQLKK
ncbi:MAG: dihydropteroate synthase [Syntrophorhabdaceae bacterium]|nr:dihydropteroate synthase [Syntrophorhabdaceae bacterium]